MARRRWYDDGCAMAHALDLVGERWALLVVRELLFGPKRFTDLRADIPGVSPDMLAQRLRDLEHSGVVRRDTLPPPAASRVYELTEWGRELEPIMLTLGRWGVRSPAMNHDAGSSTSTVILGLKALFAPGRAGDRTADVGVRVDDERFHVHVGGGQFDAVRGWPPSPDATVETCAVPGTPGSGAATLTDLIWGDLRLDDAIVAGRARVTGDRRIAAWFVTLFPVPEPAARG